MDEKCRKISALSTLGIGSLSAAQDQSWAEFVGAMFGKTNYIYIYILINS